MRGGWKGIVLGREGLGVQEEGDWAVGDGKVRGFARFEEGNDKCT